MAPRGSLEPNLSDRIDESCGIKDCRPASLRKRAVGRLTTHHDFPQGITLSCDHRMQLGWLAHHRVACTELPFPKQTLRAHTPDFFIRGKDNRDRTLRHIQIPDCG